ncbi:MAG TPA: hypothetical protein VM802_08310 [Chitinophaga sp.]|uniref:hypothetical protein n=1 Tax=Chitinophaga sp. TaxID=1869181 RepID=UPI002C5F56FD|nr:hypothetical protein [Chitinophaga sp.]HVI44859.1 hypothetical protein [Chitinophaga sp.]
MKPVYESGPDCLGKHEIDIVLRFWKELLDDAQEERRDIHRKCSRVFRAVLKYFTFPWHLFHDQELRYAHPNVLMVRIPSTQCYKAKLNISYTKKWKGGPEIQKKMELFIIRQNRELLIDAITGFGE